MSGKLGTFGNLALLMWGLAGLFFWQNQSAQLHPAVADGRAGLTAAADEAWPQPTVAPSNQGRDFDVGSLAVAEAEYRDAFSDRFSQRLDTVDVYFQVMHLSEQLAIAEAHHLRGVACTRIAALEGDMDRLGVEVSPVHFLTSAQTLPIALVDAVYRAYGNDARHLQVATLSAEAGLYGLSNFSTDWCGSGGCDAEIVHCDQGACRTLWSGQAGKFIVSQPPGRFPDLMIGNYQWVVFNGSEYVDMCSQYGLRRGDPAPRVSKFASEPARVVAAVPSLAPPSSYVAAPAVRPAPTPTYRPAAPFFYRNCTEARARGAAPVRSTDPGFGPHLDRDRDGIGCER
jgi:hypothetical protein